MTIIAITMGDPAGIGPETAVKALSKTLPPADIKAFIIGSPDIIRQAMRVVNTEKSLHIMSGVADYEDNGINVLDIQMPIPDCHLKHAPSAEGGRISYSCVDKGISLALEGAIDAIVTCPVSKESFGMAGIPYPGHTEMLADKTGTKKFSMVFIQENVAVSHVTTHCSLRNAINLLSEDRIYDSIVLLDSALRETGVASPRIAVAGLNPHAGENGLFGTEEIEIIQPAITRAARNGTNASGPFPPDTIFMRAFKGEFDGVISMIHDHGFVALKSRDFEKGVNVTIGLPIIRTSPGHGTAFDIAGTGTASEAGLVEAIKTAAKISGYRKKHENG